MPPPSVNPELINLCRVIKQSKLAVSASYFRAEGPSQIFGPGYKVFQSAFSFPMLAIQDASIAGFLGATEALESLGRKFIRNDDATPNIFAMDGSNHTLASGKTWCLEPLTIDLIKQKASDNFLTMTITNGTDFATNGVSETFGD